MNSLFVRASGALSGSAEPLVPAGVEPLVLLHAFPFSSQMFQPLEQALPDLPLLALDLPGCGLSPTIEPVTVAAAAEAVVKTLDQLGVARAYVAGISMGGYVALHLLRDYAERWAGVVLLNTKATADAPEAAERRLAVAREVLATGTVETLRPMVNSMVSETSRQDQPELVNTLENWLKEATPEGVAWCQEAMASRTDSMAMLRASGLPALVVAGGQDPFAPVAEAEAMVQALGASANLVVIQDAGHLTPLEATDALSRLIREFYRR
jgi:pimeloyl-ACP methyl ester carboxylesterase